MRQTFSVLHISRAWRWLAGKAWALGVTLRKQMIACQDRLGLYPYAAWIHSVEGPAIRAALASLPAAVKNPVVPAGRIVSSAKAFSDQPVVCFTVSIRGEFPSESLSDTLLSLSQQPALDWRLALVVPPALAEDLHYRRGEAQYARVFTLITDPADGQGQLACVPAEALAVQDADWFVPLEAGDRLAPHWSALFQQALTSHPQAGVMYWDEDIQAESGRRTQPFFKPDWSPELLFARNYLESAAFHRRVLLEQRTLVDLFASLNVLAVTSKAREVVHLPFVLQHRAAGSEPQSERLARHAQVVRAYLEQRGEQEIVVEVGNACLRPHWQTAQPLVSIIIPTKNNLHYLRCCLSTLLEKTDYPRYEVVLMDDHSSDPGVLAYYDELRRSSPSVRILANELEPFNYSRVNNIGARQALGELLLFLNNDVEILSPGWLNELVRWVLEPGVGMAGARLRYPDGAIQHAGIVIGMTGHANHVFAGRKPGSGGPFLSPDTLRNVSAVTGACLLVRRDVFEQVGGFNEDLSLVFNDVELGLRVMQNGWRVVYAPAAELIHYEGRSRARYIPPANISLGADLLREAIRAGDRYYNPNLSDEVNWPTLRRALQPTRLQMLDQIVRYKGN